MFVNSHQRGWMQANFVYFFGAYGYRCGENGFVADGLICIQLFGFCSVFQSFGMLDNCEIENESLIRKKIDFPQNNKPITRKPCRLLFCDRVPFIFYENFLRASDDMLISSPHSIEAAVLTSAHESNERTLVRQPIWYAKYHLIHFS